MKRFLYCFSVIFFGTIVQNASLLAQSSDIIYDNYIYEQEIRSIQFYSGDNVNSYPLLYLDNPVPFSIAFDELIPEDGGSSHFNATILNCDMDWQPSGLIAPQFYVGYPDKMLSLYARSVNTKIPYMHYEYTFPEEGERFTRSGNYILLIYRDGDKSNPVITRRFLVAESLIDFQPIQLIGQANPQRMRFQEFHFNLANTKGLPIANPSWDLHVKCLQNFRWDNAQKLSLHSSFNNLFRYGVDVNRQFNTGNEFRQIDLRSTRFYGRGVSSTFDTDTIWHVEVAKQVERRENTFTGFWDMNGGFYIEVNEFPDAETQGDYVETHFSLKTTEPYPELELYLIGAFTDWQTRPAYQLHYNEILRMYQGSCVLKQGFYEYQFVLKNPKTGEIMETPIEGKRRDSENFYTVLVYYKNFSDFTHRLIACIPYNY